MSQQGDALDNVVDQLVRSTISTSGVSFEGRSLKLNNKDDAQELIEAMNQCKDMHFLNLAGNTLGVEAAKEVGKALEIHKELKRALWKDLFTGRLKTEIPEALKYLGAGLALAQARLTELDMSDNAFGPIGIEGLAVLLRSPSCYTLQELRLNNNGLGIGGGKLLAKALLDCHKASSAEGQPLALKVFIAGRNRLENDGAKALANVFETLGSLQEVVMPQNGIYHVGIAALAKALTHCPQMRELNLNDNTVTWRGSKALAEALPQLPLLRVLNLGDCLLRSNGTITVAKALAGSHQQLEELILSANEIGKRAVEAILESVKGKKLKVLNLETNQFGEEGRSALEDGLREMDLSGCLASLEDDEDDAESEEEEEGSEKEDGELSESGDSAPPTPAKPNTATPAKPSIAVNNSKSPDAEVITLPDTPERPAGDVTVADYVQDPGPERFMQLGKDRHHKIISDFDNLEPEEKVKGGVALLMAVSSAAATRRPEVQGAASETGVTLYTRLVKWAEASEQLNLLNNELLVNLRLIKAEDKNCFASVPWDLEGCMLVLEQFCSKNPLPNTIRDSLQLFLSRPHIAVNNYPESKRKLLAALFKY